MRSKRPSALIHHRANPAVQRTFWQINKLPPTPLATSNLCAWRHRSARHEKKFAEVGVFRTWRPIRPRPSRSIRMNRADLLGLPSLAVGKLDGPNRLMNDPSVNTSSLAPFTVPAVKRRPGTRNCGRAGSAVQLPCRLRAQHEAQATPRLARARLGEASASPHKRCADPHTRPGDQRHASWTSAHRSGLHGLEL